jgi:hypothetical protein
LPPGKGHGKPDIAAHKINTPGPLARMGNCRPSMLAVLLPIGTSEQLLLATEKLLRKYQGKRLQKLLSLLDIPKHIVLNTANWQTTFQTHVLAIDRQTLDPDQQLVMLHRTISPGNTVTISAL